MEDLFSSSFVFEVTTISVNSEPPEPSSDSLDPEPSLSNSMPEIYSRFSEAKLHIHPNLASYIAFEKLSNNLAVIFSESHAYNLEKLLSSRITQNHSFKESEILEITIEILKALNKLASLGQPYLNLCTSNILISSSGSMKLSHPFDYYILGPSAAHAYLPQTDSSGFLFKSDPLRLGLIIIELISLMKCPQESSPSFTRYFPLSFLSLAHSQVQISSKFKEILNLMLHPDPAERYDAIDLFQHPFFQIKPTSSAHLAQNLHIYYLWLKYKNIDSVKKLERLLIANGLIPYSPAVLKLPSVFSLNHQEEYGIFVLNRAFVNLEGLVKEIKKESDSESITMESKLHSDEVSVKPESFIGKLGTLFRSKSAKSNHSESSAKLRSSDGFTSFYKYYKSYLMLLLSPALDFISIGKEGFPACLRPDLWKRILKIPECYTHTYFILYNTRRIETNKQISLDIPRCHKHNLLLASSSGQKRLETLLKIWISQYRGVKYSQGLDSIAAVCVCVFEDDEAAAYYAFERIMQKYLLKVVVNEELIGNFLLVLRNLISFVDPALSQHLSTNSISPEMYATSWLLTLYSHIFPLNAVYVLWDLLLQKPSEFIYLIAFSILQQFRKELLESSQNEIINLFSGINGKIDLEKCIKDSIEFAEKVPLGICQIIGPSGSNRPWEKELPFEIAQASRCPMISLEECSKLTKEFVFVDTRASEEYNKLRVNGSVNLPLKTGNEAGVLPTIKLTQSQLQGLKDVAKDKIIVLIGDNSLKCNSFGNILVKLNVRRVCILRGGIDVIKEEMSQILTKN